MKKTNLVLGFCLGLVLSASAQNFNWSAKYSYSTSTTGNSICTDKAGNVYVAGSFEEPLQRGMIPLTGSFLAKYSSSGSLIWSTNLINWNLIVAIGPNDTLIVSGVDSAGYYVSKYDTSGHVLQKTNLINIPGGENGKIRDITVDNLNNYYVSGFFQDTISLGSQTIYGTTGRWNLFVAKFNKRDSCLWAKTSNHSDVYECFIKTDINQNVYLSGCFLDTLSCGTSSIIGVNMNGFVCKMNSSGTTQWLYNIGNTPGKSEVVTCMDVDDNGNVYITGSFSAPLSLGLISLTPYAENNLDIFLFKLNSSGATAWAKKAGGAGTNYSRGLYLNRNSDIYMSGQYIGSIDIGGITLNSVASSSVSFPFEAFIAKYDTSGNSVSALQLDCNSGAAACFHICADTSKSVYVTGSFIGDADFGGYSQSASYPHMFLAKIDDSGSGSRLSHSTVFKLIQIKNSYYIISESNITATLSMTLKDNKGKEVVKQSLLVKDGKSQLFNLETLERGKYSIEYLYNGYVTKDTITIK